MYLRVKFKDNKIMFYGYLRFTLTIAVYLSKHDHVLLSFI